VFFPFRPLAVMPAARIGPPRAVADVGSEEE
jgi:hypothetical protein